MRLPVVSVALALTAFACAPQDEGSDDPIAEDSHSPESALDDLASGKADSAACSGIITPDQGDFGYKVALTFDDGPNLESTPLVLDVLKKHHAPATFFTVGRAINGPQAVALVQRMLAEGHLVGSHSNSHPNFKAISTASQLAEITRSEAALATAGITPVWFRFPYGNGTCAATDRVHADGMTVVGWQFGSDDWCFNAGNGYCSPRSYKYMPDSYRHDQIGWLRHEVARNHGGVMLNHDSHMYTAQHLDEWLTLLEGMGYSFVRLDDASIFPRLNGQTPPPPPFVGTACTEDSGCAFTSGGARAACYAYSVDDTLDGFCTLPCQGYCPDKTGAAPTFCATIDGAGKCVSKAGPLNDDCAKIPGTTPRAIARFVGGSGAPAATATVCVP
jgi:peptidoglycan-N-acetylglucosamine deacetylase